MIDYGMVVTLQQSAWRPPREVHGKVMPRNHIPRDEADQLSLERRDVQIRSSVANMLGSFADDAVDLMDEEFLHRGSGEGSVALCHGAFLPSSSWPCVALGALFWVIERPQNRRSFFMNAL
jgi:hypothetical protein